MRNSLTPLVFVVLVAVAAVLLTRSDVEPGMGGPTIYPGIFRLPVKERFLVASAPLDASNEVGKPSDGEPATVAARGEEWRVVVVSADDRQPLTSAAVLALAERLTTHGAVVVVDPLDAPAFPLGADRQLRVSTTDAVLPSESGGVCSGRVRVTSRLLRPADGHPMTRLLPAAGAEHDRAVDITHRSRATVGTTVSWPQRYAAMGRGIADAALARLAAGGLPALVDAQTHLRLATLRPRADWGSTLWLPPSSDTLRWDGAVQEAFVRGWIGTINGTASLDRTGAPVSSLNPLLDRLKRAGWSEQSEASDLIPGRRLFSSQRDGDIRWLTIDVRPHGWEVVVWQERGGLVALAESWISAGATTELAAYRDCPALPADLRARIVAALGAKPDGNKVDGNKADGNK